MTNIFKKHLNYEYDLKRIAFLFVQISFLHEVYHTYMLIYSRKIYFIHNHQILRALSLFYF